ncbi:MAG TPA: ATP-dependent DNA ligase [Gemmatimonadaceae bacterium]|nr:ATP-dependent DNA ligase [Gemmatimonadaceae bacterium]
MSEDAMDRTDSFARWVAMADRIRATTKRLQKLAVLEAYLPSLDDAALPAAARFLSGIVFPRHDQRTTKVGGSILWSALSELTGASEEALAEAYTRHGDSGDMVGDVLAGRPSRGQTLEWVAARFASLAAERGIGIRRSIVRDTLGALGPDEARYFAKLLGGELRIGLKEAQVEEAISRAFGRTLSAVRHANLLRGDVGEVAVLARHDLLDQATLALFHPLGFMLAQPLPTAGDIVATMPSPFVIEDKYDGIRAQAHVDGDEVRLYSRTLDDITHGYPDVVASLRGLGRGLVLDGELLAVDPEQRRRARPFAALQRRLGRKDPTPEVMAEVPAAFVGYDILASSSLLVIGSAWRERRSMLESLRWRDDGAFVAPYRLAKTEEEVETAFDAARAGGNEGLIVKDPSSSYTPGRRGKTWIKLKRALATLDVVVTGVERGHGRRNGVLSDYTFAVRASESDPTLLNVGKAYNGLTDLEIAELTERFRAITTQQFGRFHAVRPEVVLEVTFDIVQKSARHKAGYALRFPRIVRVRDDKPPAEIDTLQRVRELAGDA